VGVGTSGAQITQALRALRKVAAERLLLAADYDGTLAPIVDDPADAWPSPSTVRLLERLSERLAAVAVISGRDTATLLERLPIPRLILYGNHGLERRRGPDWEILADARPWRQRLSEVADELRRDPALARPGVAVEQKVLGLSVHYRGAADPEREGARLRPLVEAHAARHGLQVRAGRRVWELRPPVAADKGRALAQLLDEVRPAAAIYIGDDLGDRPAWEALRRFGGIQLAVGAASPEVPAEAYGACDLVLDGPPAVQELLAALAEQFSSDLP
jgi:trehalose 6-phosphate phosphatase